MEMRRYPRSVSQHFGLIIWLVLAGFVGAQAQILEQGLSLASHALAAVTQGSDAAPHGCEDDACPESGCKDRCSGDDSGTCPPQCDHCTCCAGIAPAVLPVFRAVGVYAQWDIAQPIAPEHHSIGEQARIFRPPRATTAC